MLCIPHMVAGAAIGRVLRRPRIAWPVAFVSHFVFDHLPHLDSHALFGAPQGGPTVPESVMGVTDFVVGALLVLWMARRQPDRTVLVGAAAFAIIIDLVDNVGMTIWGDWFRTWPGTAWLSYVHHHGQYNVTPAQWPLGVSVQLVVVVAAMWIVLRGVRPPVASQP